MKTRQNDFAEGKVWKSILLQAVPLTVAQFVQLLYNIVDRIYIGHLPGTNNLALTGIGVTFPIITIIAAFTQMFATGGTPLFSMARGEGDEERAERILGNVFCMIIGTGLLLMLLCFLFRRPILFLFGASEDSYFYANQYLQIYLLGTVFTMLVTGLNGFINAQGYPRIGMLTTMIGAILNLILDPILIYGFGFGVRGAAIATVFSQFVSAVWVLRFITKKSPLRLKRRSMKLDLTLDSRICVLGLSGFIVQATNALVQIVCNAKLQMWGGDLYVGIMTVLNSVREVLTLPVNSISNGSQPIIGFNYGAKEFSRVKEAIRFSAYLGIGYTLVAWLLVLIFPGFWFHVFSKDTSILAPGVEASRIYFFGFIFMALQFTGQHTFQALGFAKRSIFFSLLRKVVIVVPLTLFLPAMGFGVQGVFLAEPISNLIGGLASFLTMIVTVYLRIGKVEKL